MNGKSVEIRKGKLYTISDLDNNKLHLDKNMRKYLA